MNETLDVGGRLSAHQMAANHQCELGQFGAGGNDVEKGSAINAVTDRHLPQLPP